MKKIPNDINQEASAPSPGEEGTLPPRWEWSKLEKPEDTAESTNPDSPNNPTEIDEDEESIKQLAHSGPLGREAAIKAAINAGINEDEIYARREERKKQLAHARALGREAAINAGIDMSTPISYKEIEDRRKENPNHPSVFWINIDDNMLSVKVDGDEEDMTPEEAINKYKDNPDFVMEYRHLMQ